MVIIYHPPTVGLVFSIFVVVSNILSNLALARSYYSLYYLQISYQIAHALQATNNFTKFHQLSFFEFYSSYQCLDYAECVLQSSIGMALAVIFILVCILMVKKKKQLKTLLSKKHNKHGCIFYILLGLFEWVYIPMVSNIFYLFQQMSNPIATALAFFSACMVVTAFITSSYAMVACPDSKEQGFEKIAIGCLFTIISLSVFGIHTASANFGESSSILAACFLVVLMGLGVSSISKLRNLLKLSPMAVFTSQLHTINLVCQAISFLLLVNQLEHGEVSNNQNDSLLIFLMIVVDLLFIGFELYKFEVKLRIEEDQQTHKKILMQSSSLSIHGQVRLQQNFDNTPQEP